MVWISRLDSTTGPMLGVPTTHAPQGHTQAVLYAVPGSSSGVLPSCRAARFWWLVHPKHEPLIAKSPQTMHFELLASQTPQISSRSKISMTRVFETCRNISKRSKLVQNWLETEMVVVLPQSGCCAGQSGRWAGQSGCFEKSNFVGLSSKRYETVMCAFSKLGSKKHPSKAIPTPRKHSFESSRCPKSTFSKPKKHMFRTPSFKFIEIIPAPNIWPLGRFCIRHSPKQNIDLIDPTLSK